MLLMKNGRKLLVGVDAENIRRLTNGETLILKGEEIAEDIDICVVYGDTLKDVVKEIGMTRDQVHPDTRQQFDELMNESD